MVLIVVLNSLSQRVQDEIMRTSLATVTIRQKHVIQCNYTVNQYLNSVITAVKYIYVAIIFLKCLIE